MFKLQTLILFLVIVMIPLQTEERSAPAFQNAILRDGGLASSYRDPFDHIQGKKGAYPVPVILRSDVENYLEYFQTSGRAGFQAWLIRAGRSVPFMQEILRLHGLPGELAYVAMIESGFDAFAVSHAGATGPWQFMPSTAAQYGLRVDQWIDERRDPVKSTHAAARHLNDLHDLFGSWHLALAAYNAGHTRVQRAVLRTNSERFSDLSISRSLQKETRNYVPKFMAAVIIAADPEAYGFSAVQAEGPVPYEELTVSERTDLRFLGRLLGRSPAALRALNPELNQYHTPPGSAYVLRLPSGSRELLVVQGGAMRAVQWDLTAGSDVSRGEAGLGRGILFAAGERETAGSGRSGP